MHTHTRSIIVACGILTGMLILLIVFGFLFVGDMDPNPGVSRTIANCQTISVALWVYRGQFGNFPGGSASDILKALAGENPKKRVYLSPGTIETDESGFPLDAWKHRLEIVIAPAGTTTVSSPGKDGVFKEGWRSDDITVFWDKPGG